MPVEGAEPDQQIEILIPDRAINDPSLQLERHHGQRKHQHGQQTEPEPVLAARAPSKGKHVSATG